MLHTYASFNTSFPASIVLSIAARDETTPLTPGTPVLIEVHIKSLGQQWTTSGLFPTSLILDANASHVSNSGLSFPLNANAFDVRVRSRLYPGGPWTDYVTVSYTPEPAPAVTDPRSRFVTYKSVLDGFLRRRGSGSSNPPNADDLTDAAEFITSAYRYCLETWQWPEATITRTLTIANGFVPWPQIFGADFYQFWTSDPDAVCTTVPAVPIPIRRQDAGGLHLDTTLTSVFARFTPRAPEFRAQDLDRTQRYGLGDIVYQSTSGNMYEVVAANGALGSDLGDPSQWRCLQLLWLLADTTKLLAVADALGNSEHERAQAADLHEQVETKLNQLSLRERPQN